MPKMKSVIVRLVGLVLVVWAMAASAEAATYYVAQEAPNASDENPGTEQQPWKTLTHAVEVATKGDTVYVEAGTYRGKLELAGEGVTIRAFGDDAVILEPADEVTVIEPGAWRKVADRQAVYTCDLKVAGEVREKLLRVDGLALTYEITQGVRRETTGGTGKFRSVDVDRALLDEDDQRWTADREGKLYVNLGSEGPANHRVELVQRGPGGVFLQGANCRVKGLELHYCPLYVHGQGNIAEDCLVLRCAGEGGGDVRDRNVIRRCAFYRCGPIGIGSYAVFEENIVVGGQRWVPELESPQVPRQLFTAIWGRAIGGNGSYQNLIRYNVIADSAVWGFWNDCTGTGAYLYGNSFWRNWSGAIYNEDGCHDTRILYNALVENGSHEHPWSGYGVMISGANRCLVAYNLCLRNVHFGLGTGLTRSWPTPKDSVFLHNLVKDNAYALYFEGASPLTGPMLHNLLTLSVDRNIYSIPPGGSFCKFEGNPDITTLDDFRKLTGMDQNSRIDDAATMEDLGLGTVSFRIPDCDHPEEPVLMVANLVSRGLHQEPVGQDNIVRVSSPLSWSFFSDGSTLPSIEYGQIWAPPWRWGTELRLTGGWSPEAIPGDPLPPDGEQPFWMEVNSEKPQAPSPNGSGWWTTSLPTVPGAHIRVSLRVSGENLEPAEGQAVLALMRFSSFTDQQVSRQYLIGGDSETEVLRGTFPWQTFSKEFEAPPEARRFAFFMGLGPSVGKVRFAAVHIETLPGERAPERPMPQGVTYQPIDLTAYFNHDVDNNVTGRIGEGLEGTPGPINLSNLQRGTQLHSGVPFHIDRAIALRGSTFPQEEGLPRNVRGIRIGRQVAGLCFLHRFAYPARDREQFRYVLHFADGDTVEIPIVSGEENVLGKYQRNNVRLFPPPFDLAGGGGVAEWVNAKPTVAVESVDLLGANTGDVAVLGITAAVGP